jgi:hypothetical protein
MLPFPLKEAARLGFSKVLTDWLQSIIPVSQQVDGAETDITALQASIAALQASVTEALAAAEDAALLTPVFRFNPSEVLAVTDTHLLTEGGDFLLTEDGDALLLEAA